jgi:capsular polysaccharide biosynthesis protein
VELTGYASIARRWWRRLLLATVFGAFAGLLLLPLLPLTFESRARLLVGEATTDPNVQRAAGSLARTYADLALSRAVLTPIAERYGLDVEDLEEETQSTASEATRIVTIVVEEQDAAVAAGVANAIVDRLVAFSEDNAVEGAGITVIDAAEVPLEPSAPSAPLIVALTTVTGLVTAMLALVLVETFSRSVREEDDITRLVDVPVVGVLTRSFGRLGDGREAELALVTARLVAASRSKPNVRVAVAGVAAGQDSAIVAARLAAELAAFGTAITVIDAGTGNVAQLLRSWSDPGLTRRSTSADATEEIESVRLDQGWVSVVHRLAPMPAPPGTATAAMAATAAGSQDRWHPVREEGIGPRAVPVAFAPAASVAPMLAAAEAHPGVTVIHVDSPTASPAALRWIEVAGEAVLVVGFDNSHRQEIRRSVEVVKVLGTNLMGIVAVRRGQFVSRLRRRRTPSMRAHPPTASRGAGVGRDPDGRAAARSSPVPSSQRGLPSFRRGSPPEPALRAVNPREPGAEG